MDGTGRDDDLEDGQDHDRSRGFDLYEEGDVELRPGDLLVAFTDGVTEARSPGGEELGEERLQDFLRGAVEASTEEIASTLAESH